MMLYVLVLNRLLKPKDCNENTDNNVVSPLSGDVGDVIVIPVFFDVKGGVTLDRSVHASSLLVS